MSPKAPPDKDCSQQIDTLPRMCLPPGKNVFGICGWDSFEDFWEQVMKKAEEGNGFQELR
jgi:hypothetical protein